MSDIFTGFALPEDPTLLSRIHYTLINRIMFFLPISEIHNVRLVCRDWFFLCEGWKQWKAKIVSDFGDCSEKKIIYGVLKQLDGENLYKCVYVLKKLNTLRPFFECIVKPKKIGCYYVDDPNSTYVQWGPQDSGEEQIPVSAFKLAKMILGSSGKRPNYSLTLVASNSAYEFFHELEETIFGGRLIVDFRSLRRREYTGK